MPRVLGMSIVVDLDYFMHENRLPSGRSYLGPTCIVGGFIHIFLIEKEVLISEGSYYICLIH